MRVPVAGFEKQRIERTEKHSSRPAAVSQYIVEQECRLAAHRFEGSAALELRRTPGEEPSAPPMADKQNAQDEPAALGIAGEGVYRCENARTARETCRSDSTKMPRWRGATSSSGMRRSVPSQRRMQKRGRNQPRHQRRVLDRVPKTRSRPSPST